LTIESKDPPRRHEGTKKSGGNWTEDLEVTGTNENPNFSSRFLIAFLRELRVFVVNLFLPFVEGVQER
jgi:hypothetical protein